jgi:hypothetical protein
MDLIPAAFHTNGVKIRFICSADTCQRIDGTGKELVMGGSDLSIDRLQNNLKTICLHFDGEIDPVISEAAMSTDRCSSFAPCSKAEKGVLRACSSWDVSSNSGRSRNCRQVGEAVRAPR